MRTLLLASAISLALVATGASAQKFDGAMVPPIPPHGDIPASFTPIRDAFEWTKRDVMIPMRDGVKLHTVIVVPKGAARAPMMLDRTPYSASGLTGRGEGGTMLEQILSPAYGELARAGYIIVAQDVRGKYGSEGDYVMNRPLRGPLNATKVDHATDAYDTIDWLVKHVPESNGRVGTIGTSYDGFTTLMSLVNPHPALKASVPINPMVDVWKGDDWFHNGALRQEMIGYIYSQTATKKSELPFVTTKFDDYDTFLSLGNASNYARSYGMQNLPFWQRLSQHPAYDQFWQEQAVDKILARAPLTVPTLFIDSLWDQEDIYGAPAAFAAVKGRDNGNAHLVLGPWHHGEANGVATKLGALDFDGDTGKWFRTNVMIPFLNAHLKDNAPADRTPRVVAFETGTNQWRTLPDWPSACAAGCATAMRPLYLAAGGRLSFDSPASQGAAFDEYVSDPAKPVTYRARPNRPPYSSGSTWRSWLVDDQRFADGRPDVLTYTSEVLTKPLHLAGAPVAHLTASSSGTDSDWVVKLIDVYPDQVPEKAEMGGYQLPISMDVMRARYRGDPSKPTPLTPNKAEAYTLDMPNVDHVFLPGHRVMVQVQSSWFPLYDRNPQTYVPNIFNAPPSAYVKASQRIYRGGQEGSYVALPVVP